MEWVIAILGVGCAFFAFQIVMDYVKYRRAIKPRIERLEEARKELEARIQASRAGLEETNEQLDPIKHEVDKLEQEYLDLQQQIREERAKQKPRPIRFRS